MSSAMRIINICVLIVLSGSLFHGFAIRWDLSIFPIWLSISGTLVGLWSRRSTMIAECVLTGTSSVVLAAGGVLSLAGGTMMILGSSQEQIEQAFNDGSILLVLGAMSLLCAVVSGVAIGIINIPGTSASKQGQSVA